MFSITTPVPLTAPLLVASDPMAPIPIPHTKFIAYLHITYLILPRETQKKRQTSILATFPSNLPIHTTFYPLLFSSNTLLRDMLVCYIQTYDDGQAYFTNNDAVNKTQHKSFTTRDKGQKMTAPWNIYWLTSSCDRPIRTQHNFLVCNLLFLCQSLSLPPPHTGIVVFHLKSLILSSASAIHHCTQC